jgi:predicted metal-dependent peptidase
MTKYNLPLACTPDQLKQANERLALARAKLLKHKKALTFSVLKTEWVATTAVETLAMSKRMVCMWNPLFVLSLPDLRAVITVIEHEMWHPLRKHHARGEAVRAINGSVTHDECNRAADHEINDDLIAGGGSFGPELDKECCIPANNGWPDGLTMEEYVVLARQQQQQQKQQQSQSGDKSESGDGLGSEDAGSAGDGDTEGEGAGSGTDDPSGNDGSDGDGGGAPSAPMDPSRTSESGGTGKGGVGSGRCGSAAGQPHPAEAMLPEDAGSSKEQVDRVRSQTAKAIVEEGQRGIGKYGLDAARWAESVLTPAKVPWAKVLAKAVRGEVSARAGGGGVSYRAPARRQASIGYGAGKPVFPANRAVIPEVQVWVDTSGSVGTKELTAALAEIGGIMKSLQARVTVGACDAKVHSLQKVKSLDQVPALLKGGGGTDFRPLFQTADESKPRPDVVIVLTDGYATLPEKPPEGMRVIWVLIGSWKTKTMPYGECIDVQDD